MGDKSVWDKEIAVPAAVIQYIDEGVKEKLPEGTQFHGITPSGASYWARTAKIDATNEAGEDSPFFIKVHQAETGKKMVSSEYEAMKALYNVMPEIVAEPIAWGTYKEESDIWFYVCRYCELSDDIPDLSDFPALLAEMHRRGASKKGEFGLDLLTYGGRNPHYFPPTNSWEETFSKGLQRTFDMEEETQGPDEEMHRLRDGLMTKVIPRLLRPLETEGRTLTPTLVHGDIWDGNASVDVNTGLPIIFDATPLYAHNEYEMAPWWAPRHKMTGAYIAEYIKHYPVSEPAEDFKDRGALYGLRFDLHASSLYTGNLRHRYIVMDTMRDLLNKYPLGYEGYLKEKVDTTSKDERPQL
ncbi:fructosamine/ketosamine-3-kinase [Apiospora arundinis]